MAEAYEIGITLALQDGVSDGIAIIRRDLAALDRAIAATSANLAHLQQAKINPPPYAPASRPEPTLSPPTQTAEAVAVTIPTKRQTIDVPPGIPPTNAPPTPAAPAITFQLALPPPAPIPVSPPPVSPPPLLSVSVPKSLVPPSPSLTPTAIDPSRTQSAAPARVIIPTAPIFSPATPSPTSPAVAFSPVSPPTTPTPSSSFMVPPSIRVAAASPVAPPIPLAGTGATAAALISGVARRPDPPPPPRMLAPAPLSPAPAVQPRDPLPIFPKALPQTRAAPISASLQILPVRQTQQTIPVDGPASTVSPGSARSAPAAPPFQPAPSAGNTFRPDRPAAVSYAPPTQASPSLSLQGDITLDGARVGRWMASTLARQAARPAAGPTGPDPRQTPLWSGQAQGY